MGWGWVRVRVKFRVMVKDMVLLWLRLDGLLTPKLNIPIKLHGEQAIILCLSWQRVIKCKSE